MAKKDVKTEPEVPEVTIEQLVAVAEDFNTFMFTEGEAGIDLDLEYDDLLKEVTELAQDLVDTDTVEAETAATLEALEIACPAIVANGAEPADPEETEDDETTAAQLAADLAMIKKSSKIEKVKEIAKLYKISVPPPFLKDLAKLKAYVTGKLDGSSPAKPAGEKKAAAPKGPKVKVDRYTRGTAFADAILSDKSLMKDPDKLSAKANELYVAQGGKDNLKETHVWWTMKILPVLVKLGY